MRLIKKPRNSIDGLNIKSGPTESGVPYTPPPPTENQVGGELIPINKLVVLFSQFWPLIIILIPFILILYKKRNWAMKIFNSIIYRFLRI